MTDIHRRALLGRAALAAAAAALPVAAKAQSAPAPTAGEILMQEHGLVGRIFGVYRVVIRRLEQGAEIDPGTVLAAPQMIAGIIHAHHEREEEDIVFPRLERGPLSNLVEVLRGQHWAARGLTNEILEGLKRGRLRRVEERRKLVEAMRGFISMYEPHGVHEDTLAYPAFRESMSAAEYRDVSAGFAERERKLRESFTENVRTIARVEDSLGIQLALKTEEPEEG